MTETVLIGDEEEARRATDAQMAQTARRYGLGGIAEAITQVGGPPPPNAYINPPPNAYINPPPNAYINPQIAPVPAAFQPMQQQILAPAEHLLLTPARRAGAVRLVRMQGATRVASWTVPEDAAATVASIIQAFGITLTDLRESEEEQ